MIVREILKHPELIDFFDWFNDYKDTRLFLSEVDPSRLPEFDAKYEEWRLEFIRQMPKAPVEQPCCVNGSVSVRSWLVVTASSKVGFHEHRLILNSDLSKAEVEAVGRLKREPTPPGWRCWVVPTGESYTIGWWEHQSKDPDKRAVGFSVSGDFKVDPDITLRVTSNPEPNKFFDSDRVVSVNRRIGQRDITADGTARFAIIEPQDDPAAPI